MMMGRIPETDFRSGSNATSAAVWCQGRVCENRNGAEFEKLANLKIREALRSANCLPEEVVLLNEVAALESQADARAVRTRL